MFWDIYLNFTDMYLKYFLKILLFIFITEGLMDENEIAVNSKTIRENNLKVRNIKELIKEVTIMKLIGKKQKNIFQRV